MTTCIFYQIRRMRRFKTTTDMKSMFSMNYLRNLLHIINCQSVFWRWMVDLGRVDITAEVSMMSWCLALLHEGHLKALFHMS